jgi:hypothetical protein
MFIEDKNIIKVHLKQDETFLIISGLKEVYRQYGEFLKKEDKTEEELKAVDNVTNSMKKIEEMVKNLEVASNRTLMNSIF